MQVPALAVDVRAALDAFQFDVAAPGLGGHAAVDFAYLDVAHGRLNDHFGNRPRHGHLQVHRARRIVHHQPDATPLAGESDAGLLKSIARLRLTSGTHPARHHVGHIACGTAMHGYVAFRHHANLLHLRHRFRAGGGFDPQRPFAMQPGRRSSQKPRGKQ